MRFQTFVLALLITTSAGPAAAQSSPFDYPQWRGQQRDGGASGFVQPPAWPAELSRRWTVEVGLGYATPLVVGDRVFVFSRQHDDEVMTALAADTGAVLWRTSYAAPYDMFSATAIHGPGPRATPLFLDDKLFSLGIGGIVSAFDATSGRLLWRAAAPAEQPFYGTASSPAGDGGLVFVHTGNYDALTAFDADTGTVVWRTEGTFTYSSPLVVELDGVRHVVSVAQDRVVGVAARDGVVLWTHPFASPHVHAITPIEHRGRIIVSAQNMGVTALRPHRRNSNWVVETVWRNEDVSTLTANPVVVSNTVFGLSERMRGQFFALDATIGTTLWLGPPRQAENTAIVKAERLLFLLDDDGELIVARPSRAGFDPITRYVLADSATWAQPAISGNRVFVKDIEGLTLWTLDQGRLAGNVVDVRLKLPVP